jgi:hypothetical protein
MVTIPSYHAKVALLYHCFACRPSSTVIVALDLRLPVPAKRAKVVSCGVIFGSFRDSTMSKVSSMKENKFPNIDLPKCNRIHNTGLMNTLVGYRIAFHRSTGRSALNRQAASEPCGVGLNAQRS